MNILLIEDNLIDRMAFLRVLEKEKLVCNLEVVENIKKAKNALTKNKYELIVCDLNLPDGTAFDLAKYFNTNKFVLISGHVDPDLEEKAKSSGIFKIIPKSSNLKQLTEIVNLVHQKNDQNQTRRESSDLHLKDEKFNGILSHLKKTFDNNPVYIADIIHSFLDENPKLINRLNLASDINDKQQIIKTAHQLKSGFMLMGLKELENLSAELETGFPLNKDSLHDRIHTISYLSQQSYRLLNAALLNLNAPS